VGPFLLFWCVAPRSSFVRQIARAIWTRAARPAGVKIALRRSESILSGALVNERCIPVTWFTPSSDDIGSAPDADKLACRRGEIGEVYDAIFSNTSGCCFATRRRVFAAPRGERRPCSQSCTESIDTLRS